MSSRVLPEWTGDDIRFLRMHVGLTQTAFGAMLGARQATISEWETEVHRPRRMMRLMLTQLAKQAHFSIRS